jgi:hypothetical protein
MLLIWTLTHCPALPSKVIKPIFPLLLIVTVTALPPTVIRFVNATSPAVKKGVRGTKKSALLVKLPCDV